MRPFLSLVIPVFNEEKIIAANLARLEAFLAQELRPGQDWEIIVVDDGSSDGTAAILDRLAQADPRLVVRRHGRNIGRGRGIITGLAASRGEFVITLDADLSYEPGHITRLLAPLVEDRADVVLASAYHPQGTVKNVPYLRALTSRWGNRLLRLGLEGDLHTVTCIVRGYRRAVVDQLELTSDGKDIHLEILLKARLLNFRIMEVPADLCWRAGVRTGQKRGLSLAKFSRLAVGHLFFNFLFRPSLLVWSPVALLLAAMAVSAALLVYGYVDLLAAQPADAGLGWRLFVALRLLFDRAPMSFFMFCLSLLLLFQFLSFAFLAKQNKRYFEELYFLLTRVNLHLKNRERED